MKKQVTIIALQVLLWLPAFFLGSINMPSASAQNVQQISPQAALERLFTAPRLQPDWFAASFLDQIPLGQLQQIVAGIQAELGPYQQIEMVHGKFLILFDQGQVETQMGLNDQGQIVGLLFTPVPEVVSPDNAVASLQQFPGEVSFVAIANGVEQAALNADQPMGVGSAFKLAVLAALQQQIEAGQRSWQDVVTLRSEWRSLPSGILQDWPDGSSVTLETLATLMISVSDNTATDTLIHILGREAIEAFTGRNRPILTTREFFVLKEPRNIEILERYRTANSDAERRSILDDVATLPLPRLEDAIASGEGLLSGQPTALDIEYFFTPRELCDLIAQVADVPLMGVNPAPAVVDAADWARVAFKGGSEPGVLNMTHQLESVDGTTYCLSMTWNNPDAALDESRLFTLYGSVVNGLLETAQ